MKVWRSGRRTDTASKRFFLKKRSKNFCMAVADSSAAAAVTESYPRTRSRLCVMLGRGVQPLVWLLECHTGTTACGGGKLNPGDPKRTHYPDRDRQDRLVGAGAELRAPDGGQAYVRFGGKLLRGPAEQSARGTELRAGEGRRLGFSWHALSHSPIRATGPPGATPPQRYARQMRTGRAARRTSKIVFSGRCPGGTPSAGNVWSFEPPLIPCNRIRMI